MNAFMTLIKREYWEHRGGFFKTPIWLSGIFLLLVAMAGITGKSAMIRFDGSDHMVEGGLKYLETQATPEQLRMGTDALLYGTGSIFGFVMFIVLVFYCLGALYDDRRDRSVLFWRSLPVSDLNTVLSKVTTVMLVGPMIYLAAIILFQLVLLGVVGLIILFQGGSPMNLVWLPAEPLTYWARLFVALLLHALWLLPLYGWLLLVSSWARSRPFLWALLVPAALSLLEVWFHATASLKVGHQLGDLLLSRLSTGIAPLSWKMTDGDEVVMIGSTNDPGLSTEWSVIMERLYTLDMWVGVVVGIAFIAGAIWIRRYRDDSATE